MCTRALYQGAGGMVITGRTMDWVEDMHSNAWLFPRGAARDGAAKSDSLRWTSKYGSIGISGYESGIADGMNEEGLAANLLYLAESEYGTPKKGRPTISISTWAQYALDNFRTVAEAVEVLRAEPFQLVTAVLPNGKRGQLHLSLSDREGDSAIFQYIGGKLVIYHGKEHVVMTNSPTYDQQLAIRAYWKNVDPLAFLPGSINAADRFVRASFLIDAIPKEMDPKTISAVPGGQYYFQAMAAVLSVMRAVSVPLGITDPEKPNLSSTLWRTVADHKEKLYCFDSATSPNVFWIPLAELNFSSGTPVKKLTMAGGKTYAGNVASQFETAKPLVFLAA
ncbi:MAG: linear amide C-N hydrolase [Terracidiphilus sp.]